MTAKMKMYIPVKQMHYICRQKLSCVTVRATL